MGSVPYQPAKVITQYNMLLDSEANVNTGS